MRALHNRARRCKQLPNTTDIRRDVIDKLGRRLIERRQSCAEKTKNPKTLFMLSDGTVRAVADCKVLWREGKMSTILSEKPASIGRGK